MIAVVIVVVVEANGRSHSVCSAQIMVEGDFDDCYECGEGYSSCMTMPPVMAIRMDRVVLRRALEKALARAGFVAVAVVIIIIFAPAAVCNTWARSARQASSFRFGTPLHRRWWP